ncbi:hypothetical protein [Dickeya solani]|uniref:Secreted protein n=1 Tax=Dickeya solani TaxID=1089444 RepID=A0ABU4EJ67_9GAMM|nr:hypothetical protein [Dickeya solani]MCA7000889.1 hypothetical protein [Dickeya solani]MCZ0821769.1 hypothetical protein [Dickeya solani]MDV6994948.1 hypothetical protein [Dickeya solani]MDV7006369.1 hypothetical protein [Dickeya solani]MDV7036894.1 hypothetical protein [Dickeya solani]
MVDPTGLAGVFLLVPHCCLSLLSIASVSGRVPRAETEKSTDHRDKNRRDNPNRDSNVAMTTVVMTTIAMKKIAMTTIATTTTGLTDTQHPQWSSCNG